MSQAFDCIVLGVGGFGSGALYHLAKRGVRALGIDRFGVAHDRGSSHGETRILRKAYFEHPDYVPLCHRAYQLWDDLQAEVNRPLFELCGLMLAGLPEGEAISGARLSAKLHHVPIENIPLQESRSRFPGFRFPDGNVVRSLRERTINSRIELTTLDVVFEPDAGFLFVEECVKAHIERAQALGAELKSGETVLDWTAGGHTVHVRTDRGDYEAARLIVTAGPWARSLLADLDVSLQVVRKPVFWHEVTSGDYRVSSGTPAYYFELPAFSSPAGRGTFTTPPSPSESRAGGEGRAGAFYGFPSIDGRTIKVAEHTGGDAVPDPLTVDRDVHPQDIEPVSEFVRRVLPGVNPEPVRHSVCMYTHSPDHHFIIDRNPRYENIVIGAGFSGHGFKFTSVLGQALAELALDGHTEHPVAFLGLHRDTLS